MTHYEQQLKLYIRDMNEEAGRKNRKASRGAANDEKELMARIISALAASEETSLQLMEMSKRVMELEIEGKRLREALRPFADAVGVFALEYPAILRHSV